MTETDLTDDFSESLCPMDGAMGFAKMSELQAVVNSLEEHLLNSLFTGSDFWYYAERGLAP
jgi:hypothetical protein